MAWDAPYAGEMAADGYGPPAIGPNPDGTIGVPSESLPPRPVDAGGGQPALYPSAILDVFRFGVGVWQQDRQRQQMIDLSRWQATNAGLYQQGQAAAMYGGGGQVGVLGIAALVLVLVLAAK